MRTPTTIPATTRTRRLTLSAALLLFGCNDDSSGTDADADADTEAVGTTGPAATDATGGTTPTSSGESGDAETGDDTDPVEVGPNFGLLTFTLYPADAGGAPDQLGIAGAWRTEPFTTDDFYAVRAFGSFFPPPPPTADELVRSEPAVYDWGKTDAWVALGNGMQLLGEEIDALACLQIFKEKYPLYLGADAEFLDPACAPELTSWQPGATYDLRVYGGDAYADQEATARTPTALTVTAPLLDSFDFPVDRSKDLGVAWTADGGEGDRVVIRLWDQFGAMLTVHAADDGSYEIPAAELAALSVGAATLTVAREHVTELAMLPGRLRVVARHEVWAYPDLF